MKKLLTIVLSLAMVVSSVLMPNMVLAENNEIVEEVLNNNDEIIEENEKDEIIDGLVNQANLSSPENFFYAKEVYRNNTSISFATEYETEVILEPDRGRLYAFYYGDGDADSNGIPKPETNSPVSINDISNPQNLYLNSEIDGYDNIATIYSRTLGQYELNYQELTVTISIELPKYGFYSKQEASEDNLVFNVNSTAGRTLYLIWKEGVTAPSSFTFEYYDNEGNKIDFRNNVTYNLESIENNTLALTFKSFPNNHLNVGIFDSERLIASTGIGFSSSGDSDKTPLDNPIHVENASEFKEAISTIEEHLSGKIILESNITIDEDLEILHSDRNQGIGGETIHQGDLGYGLDIDLNGYSITVTNSHALTLKGDVIHFLNSQYDGGDTISSSISGYNENSLVNNECISYFDDNILLMNNAGVVIAGNGNQINLEDHVILVGKKGIVLNHSDFNYVNAKNDTRIETTDDAVTINALAGESVTANLNGSIISNEGAGIVVNSKARKSTAYDTINIGGSIIGKTAGIEIISGEINVHSSIKSGDCPAILIQNSEPEEGAFVNIDISNLDVYCGSHPIIEETYNAKEGSNIETIVIRDGDYTYTSDPFVLSNEDSSLKLTGGFYSSDVTDYINSNNYQCINNNNNYQVVEKTNDVFDEESFKNAIKAGASSIHVINSIAFEEPTVLNINSLPLRIHLDSSNLNNEIVLENISLTVDENTEHLNSNSALTIDGGELIFNSVENSVIDLDGSNLELVNTKIVNEAGAAISFKDSDVKVFNNSEVVGKPAIFIKESDSTTTHLEISGKLNGFDGGYAVLTEDTIYSIMVLEPAEITSTGTAMYLKGKPNNGNPTNIDFNNGKISGEIAVELDGPVMFHMMSDDAEGMIHGTEAAVKFAKCTEYSQRALFQVGHGTLSSDKDVFICEDGAIGSVDLTGGTVTCGKDCNIIKEGSDIVTSLNGGTKYSKPIANEYIHSIGGVDYSCQPVKIIDNKIWYGIVRILQNTKIDDLSVGLYDQNNSSVDVNADQYCLLNNTVNVNDLANSDSLGLILTIEDEESKTNDLYDQVDDKVIINDVLDINILETVDDSNVKEINETSNWEFIRFDWKKLKDQNGNNYNEETINDIVIYHEHNGNINRLAKLNERNDSYESSYFYILEDTLYIATKQFSIYAFGTNNGEDSSIVSFDTNGLEVDGNAGVIRNVYKKGDTLTFPTANPELEFEYWLDINTDVVYYPGDTLTLDFDKYEFIAVLANKEAEINFFFEGGLCDGIFDYMFWPLNIGDRIYLPIPEKINNYFVKWIDIDTNEEYYPGCELLITKKVYNLQAIWETKNINCWINMSFNSDHCEYDGEGVYHVKPGTKLSLLCEVADAVIYYKTDKMEDFVIYDNEIVINENTILNYYASRKGANTFTREEIIHPDLELSDYEIWGDINEEFRYLFDDDPTNIPEGMWFVPYLSEDDYYGMHFDEQNNCYYMQYSPYIDQTPYFNVFYGKQRIYDYTVSYKNNKNVGTATVTYKLKGDYSGTVSTTYEIRPMNMTDNDSLYLENYEFIANGKKISAPALYVNGFKLKAGTDYTVEYLDSEEDAAYIDEGPWRLKYSGIGNYTGEYETTIEIFNDKESISKATISGLKNCDYGNAPTLEEIENSIVVKDGKNVLSSKEDYTVEVSNYWNPDTYEVEYNPEVAGIVDVIVRGANNYIGEKTTTFNINGVALSKAKISVENVEFDPLTWDYPKPNFTVTYNNVQLKEGKDFEYSYTDRRDAGTANIYLYGLGKYTGQVVKSFKITPYDLAKDERELFNIDYGEYCRYQKGGVKPYLDITCNKDDDFLHLNENYDYSITYKNNNKIGDAQMIVKGKGNYTGQIVLDYKITKEHISSNIISVTDKVVSSKPNQYATNVTITTWNGIKLQAGTDYDKNFVYRYAEDVLLPDGTFRHEHDEVQKTDVIPVNTLLQVEIYGKGNYIGSYSSQYRIIENDISKATVTIPTQYFKGMESVYLSSSQITVKLNGIYLSDRDFEIVGYSNNWQKGNATVTIRGKGNYGGTKDVKFKIDSVSLDNTYIFNGNGSTSGTISTIKLTAGKSKTLKVSDLNRIKKTGYTLLGYGTSLDSNDVDITVDKDYTFEYDENRGQVVYYAKWKKDNYKYNYNLNGIGSLPEGIEEENGYCVDDRIVLVDPDETLVLVDGIAMKFDGWYSDTSLKKKITEIKRGSTGNIELYAKWSKYVGIYEESEGRLCYQQKDGTKLKSNKPFKIGDNYYCFDQNGYMVLDDHSYEAADGKKYWINDNGTVAINSWGWETDPFGVTIYRHFDSKGNVETGLKTYNEIDPITGKNVKNTYYLNPDPECEGIRIFGEPFEISNGKKIVTYYFDNDGIVVKNRLYRLEDGHIIYLDANGQMVKNKIVDYMGYKYYLDENGYTLEFNEPTVYEINGKEYCIVEDGRIVTNEIIEYYDEGYNRYSIFYGKDGLAVKGWYEFNGTRVYADNNNHLVTEPYTIISNKWYGFDGYGYAKCNIDELEPNGQILHYDSKGVLTSTTIVDNGYLNICTETFKKVGAEYRIQLSMYSGYVKPVIMTMEECSVSGIGGEPKQIAAEIVGDVNPYIAIKLDDLNECGLNENSIFSLAFDLKIICDDDNFVREYGQEEYDFGNKLIRISH